MNPLHWEDAVRRLQRNVDLNHQSGLNNIMGDPPRTNNDWDTYCGYSKHTVSEPHNSIGINVGWEGLSPTSHNFHSKQSEVEDPDGEPLEMDKEDPELARKRKELREIEEQIIRKKFALSLKKVEPFVKKTTSGFSCHEQSAACNGESLRDRVNVILQQRHSLSFLSKAWSPKERMNSSNLSKDGLLHKDHPLKLRVKALMKQRCSDPCVLPTNMEVPDVPLHPPRQSISPPAKGENSADNGFQRFLRVLNKGVDMDLLSRIVNDDSEDLPLGEGHLNIEPLAVESQPSNSGASLPGPSQTSSRERKTEAPSRERSHSERLSLPDDEEKNDRGDSFGTSSRSKSPLAVKKKKEEEENTKVNEQREQLQNILKTLGLNLEVEEMNKLADRTQERLYGKKCEGRHRTDSRGEQESRQRASHRHYRNSSSSSSSSHSSSSSRSPSRSFSLSPSRRWRSRSRDSNPRRTSERSHSRDRLKCQDDTWDSKEAQRPRDKDGKDSQKISTYQHPQDQTYPHPHPAAFSSFSDYSLSQYSQCTTYHSGTYSSATNSYWTYTQGAIPPPPNPSGYPYPQNTSHHFPAPVAPPNMVYPRHNNFEDINFFLNPDLSTSEGQTGSGRRCLHVISTKQSARSSQPQNCLKQLTKALKKRKKRRLYKQRKKEGLRKIEQKMAANQSQESVQNVEVSQGDEAEQPEDDVKREPTEEEIKANLRKKLEAFNQKVKQKAAPLANSLTS